MIKKRIGLIIAGICIIFVIIYVLQCPRDIKKEVVVNVYTASGGEQETTVLIDGKIKNNLFSEEAEYIGDFQIEHYEPSCREGTKVRIVWYDNQSQSIRFMQNGNSSTLDIKSISIDKTMEDIEIVFLDGTIIS